MSDTPATQRRSGSVRPEPEPTGIVGRRVGGEPSDEREHFEKCAYCGQLFDMRDLDQVLHHDRVGHSPLPRH